MNIEKVTNEVCDNKKIELGNSITCIEKNTDLEIIGKKKEYSIVGDSLYASISSEQAPQWLTAIIDNVVNSLISSRLNDLNKAIDSINTSLMELEVAKNQYQELINIDSRIDEVLSSRLQTLNATIQQNSANIIELDIAKVTTDEALAIATDHVNAQIRDGEIHSLVTEINNTIANNEIAAANRIQDLESVYDDNESKVRSILSNSAGAYTATANAITELEVNLNEELYGAAGLENTLKAEDRKVESKFAYNSIIGVNGKFYRSGFGLSALTTGGTGTEANPYNSEFWINAQKFKFTNDNMTGQVAPFTIDASGITPQITFNGKVSFTNLTNVPQLGSTPQEVVDAVNAGNTTTIDGGKITTGSITANQIKANSVSADRLTSTNGQSTVWTGGGLVSSNFNGNVNGNIGNPSTGFRLSSNAAGTSTDPNIYGAYIKGATIEGAHIKGATLEGTSLAVSDVKVRAESYPNNFGTIFLSSGASAGSTGPVYSDLYVSGNYSSGFHKNRMCRNSQVFFLEAIGAVSNTGNGFYTYLQVSVNGGKWANIASIKVHDAVSLVSSYTHTLAATQSVQFRASTSGGGSYPAISIKVTSVNGQ